MKKDLSKRDKFIKFGKWLLIGGTGPLLLINLLSLLRFPVSDNPIGLALLFIVTFPLAIILLIIGALTPRSDAP